MEAVLKKAEERDRRLEEIEKGREEGERRRER